MAALIIFEDGHYRDLLPLVYWRTVSELRVGYARICDYILANMFGDAPAVPEDITVYCRREMAGIAADRFAGPVNQAPDSEVTFLVNARTLLTTPIEPQDGPGVQWHGEDPVVIQADRALLERLSPEVLLDSAACHRILQEVPDRTFVEIPRVVRYPWHLITANCDMILRGWNRRCIQMVANGRVWPGVHLLNEDRICFGEDCTVKPGTVIDAEEGPVIIGCNTTIMPNATLIGPCFIGEHSVIQPNAVIRNGTTIGPWCKIGGEVSASIFQGCANKSHDGFLGHSFVGEWVNLGADTVNSNLKNTYGPVRVPINGREIDTGLTFVGVMIADHCKSGIGQFFPTGAVVGFGSSVATGRLAPKFVPSFSWLTGEVTSRYDLERCLTVAKRVMMRRNIPMTAAEEEHFRRLPAIAASYENFAPAGS